MSERELQVWSRCLLEVATRMLLAGRALHVVCDSKLTWCSSGVFASLWAGRPLTLTLRGRATDGTLSSHPEHFLIAGSDAQFVAREVAGLPQLDADTARAILTWPPGRSPRGEMQAAFTHCWQRNLLQVVAVLMQEPVELHTYFPFGSALRCRDFAPVLIDRFGPDGWERGSAMLYPDKLRDMQGCPMRVASISIYPVHTVVPIEGDQLANDYAGNLSVGGYLSEWFTSVLRAAHFRATVHTPADGVLWGNARDDTGLHHELLHDHADMAFAYTTLEGGPTQCVLSEESLCFGLCVPAVPENQSFLEPLARPLQWPVWLALLACSGVSVVSLLLVGRLWRRRVRIPLRLAFSFVFSPLIGRGPLRTPSSPSFRFAMALTYCFSLVVSSVYVAVWHSLLAVPVTRYRINTLQDVLESDIPFLVQSDIIYLLDSVKKSGDPVVERVLQTVETREGVTDLIEIYKTMGARGSHATLTTREACSYANKSPNMKFRLFTIPDYCMQTLPEGYVMVRRGSPFFRPLRDISFRLRESGLTAHWSASYFRVTPLKSGSSCDRNNCLPSALDVQETMPAFWILVIGAGLGVLAFGCENAVSRLPGGCSLIIASGMRAFQFLRRQKEVVRKP